MGRRHLHRERIPHPGGDRQPRRRRGSDQRRHQFTDPRLAHTTIDEWIRARSDAHRVADITWATYDSHLRNHILPRWSGTALGAIQRIAVKGWVNTTRRASMADKSAQDILVLFSMILGEAVDEGLIGANPCLKLRISFDERPERPHAATDEVDALAGRMDPDAGLMVRRRCWLPALAGGEQKGWPALNQELHVHDLRHTHETWLVEDRVPRIMRLVRLGHKRKDVNDIYSHVTDQMIHDTLRALQRRWEQDGGWTWQQTPAVGRKAA